MTARGVCWLAGVAVAAPVIGREGMSARAPAQFTPPVAVCLNRMFRVTYHRMRKKNVGGRPPQRGRAMQGTLTIRLLPDEIKQLRAIAKKQGRSMGSLIREAIEEEWKIDGSK